MDSCLTVSNHSYLYYDESKNEFFLKVDFSDFRTAKEDSIENWLNKVKDTSLIYRAIFEKEKFPVLGVEERRTFKLNGRIFYNNTWRDQGVEITLYSSPNSLLGNTQGSINHYSFESYKVNFSIPFVPSDFINYDELYYKDQTININVTLGRINVLKPGMEPLLSEVYYESTR